MIGEPMLFIRTNRCNLRCNWCDSRYTFSGGSEMPLRDVLHAAREAREKWICLTGGEPLLQQEAFALIEQIGLEGKNVVLETGGSLSLERYASLDNLIIDMDVKTPSSGEEASIHIENLKFLRTGDYVKFVIQDQIDYDYAKDFIHNHGDLKSGIVFQPAWGTDIRWLTEQVLHDNLRVRVLPQLHKLIWGEIPGV